MRLPDDPIKRRDAYIDLGRQCATDRSERKAYHAELRQWYTRGTSTEDRVRYNKIKSHIKRSASYLFQSESVRFGAVLGPEYGEQFDQELDAATTDFHRTFHDSRIGRIVTLGVRWAHVYPTVIWKVTPHGDETVVTLVPDSADIGVLEGDRPFSKQEAYVHFFWQTLPQAQRLIAGHVKEADLLQTIIEASETGGGSDEPTAPTVERLMFSSVSPQMQGVVSRGMPATQDLAMVDARRALFAELWIADDRIGAWRCVTCLASAGQIQRVIWDRRASVVADHDPFVALSLEEMPDYTWGLSETDDLSGLQEWHEHRAQQIDRLMELQLDPPIVLGGFGGLSDERAKRLRMPGGTLATSIPNPTANRLAPQMPPEAFAELQEIGKFFHDAGGLPGPLQGQSDQNLRDQGVGAMAMLGAAPTLEKAMAVEYAVSELATLMWRVRRALHEDPLYTVQGKRFLLSQLPEETVMQVASHSASPLYREATKQDAFAMTKAGMITKDRAVELIHPPMVDVLRAEARKLEQAAAQRQERILKMQEDKAAHSGRSR